MRWICIRENFKFSHFFQVGDVVESEENLGAHFVLMSEGFEALFPTTGRRFVVEGNQITGVWDG
jgi:hypothetical protein